MQVIARLSQTTPEQLNWGQLHCSNLVLLTKQLFVVSWCYIMAGGGRVLMQAGKAQSTICLTLMNSVWTKLRQI
jgi:hypothetical protein